MKNFLSGLFILHIIFPIAYADAFQDLTVNIRSVCMAPDQKGKYWNIVSEGDAKIKIGLLGTNASIGGDISAGEWDGIQKVLKEQQAADNEDYRDCVRAITPIFLKNFTLSEEEKSPVLVEENNFQLNIKNYEEGDVAEELGENLLILRRKNKNVISALNSNPGGNLIISKLNLRKQFRVEILQDMNTRDMTFILRTRDDDLTNDISIKMDNSYIFFGDTKRRVNDEETGYRSGEILNSFILYIKKGVAKFYINDVFFGSKKIEKNLTYGKFLIKDIQQKDYIYDISGYNIGN